jgi:Flp pilus assembly protein TadG
MRCFKDERGTVFVIVVAALVALLGLAAITIDVGLLFLSRGRLINAVDMAALSGAQFLPENPVAAENAGRDYAVKNGARADEVNIAVIAAERIIS